MPKGFFPQQDTGIIMGTTDAAQDISFTAMTELQQKVARIVLADPAVATLGSFIGAGGGSSTVNNGRMFITLKPRSEREASAPTRSSPACAGSWPASPASTCSCRPSRTSASAGA